MQPTSDERRDLAATMRIISGEGVRNLTLGEVLNSILTGGAPQPTTEMAILACLADLIDPTCHDVGDPYDGRCFECSACGEMWKMICGSPSDNGLNFCPCCGARVVRDDDASGD